MSRFGALLFAVLILVLDANVAPAAEPILGRWAIDPEGCKVEGDTAETAPLFVTQNTVKWFVAHCTVGKSYKVGKALYIQARCSGEGKRYTIPITLDLVAPDRLAVTWDRSRVKEMMRCR
jgi:hypothetical protein